MVRTGRMEEGGGWTLEKHLKDMWKFFVCYNTDIGMFIVKKGFTVCTELTCADECCYVSAVMREVSDAERKQQRS